MPDYWRHSGFHLTTRVSDGACVPGADLLRAYFARPELAPVANSCAAETRLFARLQDDPYAAVDPSELSAVADSDARDNYAVVLRFRSHLLAAGTLERAYRGLFIDAQGRPRDFAESAIPPVFADQLAQMILRNILDDCVDGLVARAAELFFREQRAHVADGQVLLADLETVQTRAFADRDGGRYGNLGRLIADAKTPLRSVDLDVLDASNASTYWNRDERHDTAIQINFGQAGLAALCSVIERWIAHFYGIEARVEPVRQVETACLRWYVGLDGTATRLMNDLYNGASPDEAGRRSIIAFMALRFCDEAAVLEAAKGHPCYLALAMDDRKSVRMKPQNILLNLPLRRVA